jgi:hypothetical protein
MELELLGNIRHKRSPWWDIVAILNEKLVRGLI